MSSASSLDEFQRDFAAALTAASGESDDARMPAFARQRGFAVYRNTVAAACVDALAANFPVVLQIVGEAWFRDAVLAYARQHPPQDGSLASYGDGFAVFLSAFAPARELPYLPGVAQLDRSWTEAHLAADAPSLDSNGLQVDAARLAASVLVPHPATRWARFIGVPAFTIWRRHRDGESLSAELDWRDEQALIVRPGATVQWHASSEAALAFLDACARGETFAVAAEHIGDAIVSVLPPLLAAGAFTALQG